MAKLTLKSTVAEALKNPRAVALAEKIHPGITRHPALFMVKKYPLEKALEIKKLGLTREKLEALLKQVNGE